MTTTGLHFGISYDHERSSTNFRRKKWTRHSIELYNFGQVCGSPRTSKDRYRRGIVTDIECIEIQIYTQTIKHAEIKGEGFRILFKGNEVDRERVQFSFHSNLEFCSKSGRFKVKWTI